MWIRSRGEQDQANVVKTGLCMLELLRTRMLNAADHVIDMDFGVGTSFHWSSSEEQKRFFME